MIQPTPDDCATVRLWSNGWHASLALPADVFDDEHPVRALFPDDDYFLIGWGARDFYAAESPGVFKALTAIIPPTRSVIHVIADDRPVEESLWRPKQLVEFAVSRAGAIEMADQISRSIIHDERGAPVIVSEGRVAGSSYFVAARENFHLFNMCNHWAARRLRAAGVPVHSGVSFTSPALLRAVAREMPAACPTGE